MSQNTNKQKNSPHAMLSRLTVVVSICIALSLGVDAFSPSLGRRLTSTSMSTLRTPTWRLASEAEDSTTAVAEQAQEDEADAEPVDEATRLQLEKQKRADELRAQEVFMKRTTGVYVCKSCDWEYDPEKGDSFLIGGMIKPGTAFEDTPSNWRCPTCRASKDQFEEVVETIPGFEVNQGYGFGTNSMTTGEKNTLIWGGLAAFFALFLGGYALS